MVADTNYSGAVGACSDGDDEDDGSRRRPVHLSDILGRHNRRDHWSRLDTDYFGVAVHSGVVVAQANFRRVVILPSTRW